MHSHVLFMALSSIYLARQRVDCLSFKSAEAKAIAGHRNAAGEIIAPLAMCNSGQDGSSPSEAWNEN